jgi:hypothetical protein
MNSVSLSYDNATGVFTATVTVASGWSVTPNTVQLSPLGVMMPPTAGGGVGPGTYTYTYVVAGAANPPPPPAKGTYTATAYFQRLQQQSAQGQCSV